MTLSEFISTMNIQGQQRVFYKKTARHSEPVFPLGNTWAKNPLATNWVRNKPMYKAMQMENVSVEKQYTF